MHVTIGAIIGDFILIAGSFLLLIFLVKKFAWGNITSILEERSKKITDDIDGAESARKKAEELAQKRENELAGSRQEATTIIEHAKETAEKNIEAEKKSDAPAEIAQEKTSETGAQTLYSPLEGTAIPLSEVKDATFASEVLGRGMAVIPSKGEVKAPCDATVSTIFDTKHAIGLATESGLELLIHIGVDTVELGGKFYTAHVKDGDVVKKGQTLITFDMDAIKAAGYDVTTPLIVTNTDDYEEVKMLAEGTVNNGSEVLEVK